MSHILHICAKGYTVLELCIQHVKLRFHNRFIYVGVDISVYALLTGERS